MLANAVSHVVGLVHGLALEKFTRASCMDYFGTRWRRYAHAPKEDEFALVPCNFGGDHWNGIDSIYFTMFEISSNGTRSHTRTYYDREY